MEHSELIGKTVLSSEFGVGKVVDIDNLGMGERLFLVIECGDNGLKSFIPVEEKQSYRFIAEEAAFVKELAGIKDTKVSLDFDSKKDRINYFKLESKKQNLAIVTRLLAELNSLEDRGSMENQIFTKLVDSLVLEYMTLKSNTEDEAKSTVMDYLEKEPKK